MAFYDAFQKINCSLHKKQSTNIVFIDINQKSLDFFKKTSMVSWPWPRQMYVPIIRFLKRHGAADIAFDIIFSSYSTYGRDDDEKFRHSLKQAGNVFLPIVSGTGNPTDSTDFIEKFSILINPVPHHFKHASFALTPLKQLTDAAKGIGDVHGYEDADGVFRKGLLYTKIGKRFYPSLPLALYLNGRKRYSPANWILRDSGFVHVKFIKPTCFHKISALDAIKQEILFEQGKNDDFPDSILRNKIVIIGTTAPGLLDLKPTSISPTTAGMYVHAVMYENLKHKNFIKFLNKRLLYILILGILLIFLFFYMLWRNNSTFKIVLFSLFIVLILSISAVALSLNLFIPPSASILSTSAFFILLISLDYAAEGREKRVVKKMFEHYVSAELLSELLRNPDKVKPGGDKRVITVMFSDIESFTTISEKLSSYKVVKLLNIFLELMSEIIMKYRGYIDKYEGDAIMAFWNAPVLDTEYETLAVNAAIDCINELKKHLNPELQKMGFPQLNIRIGINTGEAVVGNVGSKKRVDYTIIGDNVNLGSRLEGINKIYKTNIIISEFTRKNVKHGIVFRELDTVRVKGKEKPVRIFEVIGREGEVDASKLKIIQKFTRGLFLYRTGKFEEAARVFEEQKDEDAPSFVFYKRCLELLKQPPSNWTGIYTMHTK